MGKIAVLVATWFYTGLIPPFLLKGMAGTYGSFFAIPLCYLSLYLSLEWFRPFYIMMVIVILFLGLLSISIAEDALGPRTDWKGKTKTRDQNQIVIDEVFGMMIACSAFLDHSPEFYGIGIGLAFFLFRFFDIVKVWPAKFFDGIETSWGVMMDDYVAGVYASVILMILLP